MIFRNDDVCPNTNLVKLEELYNMIRKVYPEAKIISGVTLFGKSCKEETVYPNAPFKDRDVNWFYDVDRMMKVTQYIPGEIASHGLFHIDHTKVSKDTQEMSIVTSCNYLQTKMFIPPFNRYNEDTIDVCRENDIEILCGGQWTSLDFNFFDPSFDKWYFHSWKFTPERLMKKLVLEYKGFAS